MADEDEEDRAVVPVPKSNFKEPLSAAAEVQKWMTDTAQFRLEQVEPASATLKALYEIPQIIDGWANQTEIQKAIQESASEAARLWADSQQAFVQNVPQWARQAEELQKAFLDSQRALAVAVPDLARQAEEFEQTLRRSIVEAARVVADTHVALGAVPHWIKEAEALQRAFLDSQRTLVEAIPNWSRQAEEIQKAFQDSVGESARLVADAQRALQVVVPEWAQHADAIHRTIQDAARFWVEPHDSVLGATDQIWLAVERNFARSDHVGRLGWTLTWEMDFRDVASLSAMQESSEADAYMIEWYGANDSDLQGLERRLLGVEALEPFRIPIRQSFAAFRRGDFAIAIPCLIAALERAIRTLVLPDHFFSTKVEKGVKSLYDKVKSDGPNSMVVFFWMSLWSFVQWLYAHYGETEIGMVRVFRHGIQHGTQAPPNEKSEALRLFHALDAVSGLYKEGRSLQALSEPRKPN